MGDVGPEGLQDGEGLAQRRQINNHSMNSLPFLTCGIRHSLTDAVCFWEMGLLS